MKRTALTLMMLLGMGLAMAGTSPKQPVGVSAPKADETFVMPPFVSNFDEPADFQDNWRAVDLDGDDITWFYELHDTWPALDGTTDEGGCLRTWHNREKAVDDWLIMSTPIRLAQGKAYVAFVYASAHRSPAEPERLAVYCGKDADPAELSKGGSLETWTFYGREWKFKLIEVNIAEAGDYYFALQACSDVDRLGFYVDEIEIGQGEYKGVPNLSLDYLYLPISSCNLGESEVSLRVINRGKTEIESFTMAYSVNDGSSVSETFNRKIGVLDTVRVAFAQKADLSADGNYTVKVNGTVTQSASGNLEAENTNRDNEITGETKHFT
ncbi:MAG: choice-of-anchor J domain-containing protein, partial [Bacteroidales bacterium]|nr:choice-of-anchor J domain-containing protein [Bacteroidales bacterium]